MATAGFDRTLLLPNVPLRAQNIWEEKVREIGVERVQRAIEARNPNPQDIFSMFQRKVQEALQYCRISFDSHPFQLPLFDSQTDRFLTFRPDYRLRSVKINGREVLLEPHTVFYLDEARVRKFELFEEIYGHIYYLVWITDSSPSMLDKKLTELGRRNVNFAHEVWHLMDNPPNDGEYHNRYLNMKNPPKAVILRLRSHLIDLQRRDGGPMPLIAPVNL